MKKLLLTFLIVALAFSVQAQEPAEKLFFGGVNYDETAVVSLGFAFPVAGDLYSFNYTNIGEYGSSLFFPLFYLRKIEEKSICSKIINTREI